MFVVLLEIFLSTAILVFILQYWFQIAVILIMFTIWTNHIEEPIMAVLAGHMTSYQIETQLKIQRISQIISTDNNGTGPWHRVIYADIYNTNPDRYPADLFLGCQATNSSDYGVVDYTVVLHPVGWVPPDMYYGSHRVVFDADRLSSVAEAREIVGMRPIPNDGTIFSNCVAGKNSTNAAETIEKNVGHAIAHVHWRYQTEDGRRAGAYSD